ncbi:MAG: nucleotidyl transferase AbiEii/AbiGii toxin family protein [Planctomycetes bacterium]|nr:nucleotidyl transferase AbiEii/AbiGii toxin family protein [Planctomycetota bacterium]
MTRKPRDIAASVRQRLLNLSRTRKEDFQAVLTRYGIERVMYRLARSPHGNEFVLKGAVLFTLWTGEPHRATWDLDLLGRGTIDITRLEKVFREVCEIKVDDDGLAFDAKSVRGERIREDLEYEGVRIHLDGRLGVARIALQIDVGFGDAVTPRPQKVAFPTLLDFPAPALKVYPRESVVAEKFQAMVVLGIANSRMKDFYDVWALARAFAFDGGTLSKSIKATFERRRTPLPTEEPLALSPSFADDRTKQAQWKGFIRKGRLLAEPPPFSDIVDKLRGFLLPPTSALVEGRPFDRRWPANGPWRA